MAARGRIARAARVLKRRRVTGTWYRIVRAEHAREILSLEPSRRHGARYNPPGEFGALYAARPLEGAAQEVGRRAGADPSVLTGRVVGAIEVSIRVGVDLTSRVNQRILADARIPLAALVDPTSWASAQEVARALRSAGVQAIIFPPASGGAYRNIAVFSDRLRAGSRIRLRSVRLLRLRRA